MKMKVLFASALAALAFVGCQNDMLNGDQNEMNGKTDMLQLRINAADLKTRATWDPATNTLIGEKVINNLTVFIFNGDEFDGVQYVYMQFTTTDPFISGKTYEIPISANATNIKVIANLGDPTVTSSPLGLAMSAYFTYVGSTFTKNGGFSQTAAALLDMIRLNLYDNATVTSAIQAETNTQYGIIGSGVAAAPQGYASLAQSGFGGITPGTGNTPASGSVTMKFLAARISIEEVTLFGLYGDENSGNGFIDFNSFYDTNGAEVGSITSSTRFDASGTALVITPLTNAYDASDVYSIQIESTYILNTPASTQLFGLATMTTKPGSKPVTNALITNTQQLYTAPNKLAPTGTALNISYYPYTEAPYPYALTNANELNANWAESIPVPVDDGTNSNTYVYTYPTFYTWENADNGDPRTGITLAVIECQVVTKPITGTAWTDRLAAWQATGGVNESSQPITILDEFDYDSVTYPALTLPTATTRYYTVVLDNTVNNDHNTAYANYSTKRGVHYHIKASIQSKGSNNPYLPFSASIKIFDSSWEDQNIETTFKQ